MQQKKGQAAMEFLMTYGWAILAAIVAIGVLAYFGVFSPGNLAGSSAILNNPLYAASWQVTSSNVTLEVTNNGGDNLLVYSYNVTGTGSSNSISCGRNYFGTSTGTPTTAGAVTMTPGTPIVLSSSVCAGTLTAGNNFAGSVTIKYFKSGSSLNQTVTGTIRAPIQ